MMKFGLLDTEIENIHKIFSQNQEIEKVIIFGSRAKGNYRNNSDIDLVIFGNINLRILNQINIELYFRSLNSRLNTKKWNCFSLLFH